MDSTHMTQTMTDYQAEMAWLFHSYAFNVNASEEQKETATNALENMDAGELLCLSYAIDEYGVAPTYAAISSTGMHGVMTLINSD